MTWAAVGTAIAVGAGVGAGSQLIQGKGIDDALRGALIGGATGAITGGAGAALGGASGSAGATLSTEAASQIAPELVNTAAVNAIPFDTVVQQAVPEVASAGINQITPEIMNAINQGATDAFAAQGAGTQVAGTAMNVAPTPLPVAGAPTGIQTASGPVTSDVAGFQNDQAVLNMVKNYQGGPQPELSPEVLEAAGIKQVAPNVPAPTRMTEADLAQMTFAETGQYPNQPLVSEPPGAMPDVSTSRSNLVSEPPTNPFMEGFASVKEYVKKNPLQSAVIGYAGLSALDSFGPKEDPRKKRTYVNKYPISPNFQPSRPQPNVYRPSYAGYAEGGITSFDDEAGVDQFAPGGSAREKRDPDADFKRYYSMMNARPEAAADEEALRKPRFARDDDADTRYQDALTAALIRQKKNNARANIGSPSIKRPTPLGTINLAPPGTQQAASGGIMGYNLGGYAAGGNPRLLKGPGDGMSDDIPAVIGRKQPARLADGEFVVPADVVSHLGNGSTDAGAKKLHQMMDRIRTDRTGRKKQAPEVNADKYLPGKKKASGGIMEYAEGGITGYAEGGDIASLYTSILGRDPDPEGLAAWQKALDTGTSFADIKQMFKDSQEARTNTVKQIYNEQLGREAEAEGLANWLKVYNSGQTAEQISKAIATAKEGQNMDIQSAASAYRKVLGRNPEPEGLQFWLSLAQSEGLTNKQLMDRIAEAAAPEMKARNITKPFTEMQLAALESDPLAGYYSEKDIYDVAPDAENVSMINGRKVQFVTPVTRQAVVSNFINGVYTTTPSGDITYTATPGKDVLNLPHVQAAVNVARANGTLSDADYGALVAGLNKANTPEAIRAVFNKPQGQVVVDAVQGQQIGEAGTIEAARAEAALRQPILTAQMAQNPGTYLSNATLTDAYRAAGVSIPADYSFYKGVDTRDRTSNLLTPENLRQKRTELVKELNKNNPYKTAYDPISGGTDGLPDSVRDPYSDEGLKILYGRMMDQYGPPPEDFINPATAASTPYTYKPPVSKLLQNEAKAKADYDAKVAAEKLAYDKAPITEANFDANAYLKAYPEVGNPAVWQSTPYAHYLEATSKGDPRTATRLPFTPTPYAPTPLIAANPTAAAPTTSYFTAPSGQVYASEAAYNAAANAGGGGGGKAGGIAKGIASIKHRKRRA